MSTEIVLGKITKVHWYFREDAGMSLAGVVFLLWLPYTFPLSSTHLQGTSTLPLTQTYRYGVYVFALEKHPIAIIVVGDY